jgi:hypothetical protein
MPDKDPTSYSILTYGWVVALSLWGGLTQYIRRGRPWRGLRTVAELIGDLVTSGFSGILTFYLCEASQLQPLVTAALVGISGHMGSRAIFTIERLLTRRFGAKEPA